MSMDTKAAVYIIIMTEAYMCHFMAFALPTITTHHIDRTPHERLISSSDILIPVDIFRVVESSPVRQGAVSVCKGQWSFLLQASFLSLFTPHVSYLAFLRTRKALFLEPASR